MGPSVFYLSKTVMLSYNKKLLKNPKNDDIFEKVCYTNDKQRKIATKKIRSTTK